MIGRLNLLERRLVESRTTIIIPFDNRVLFASSLNVPNSPVGFPKVPKPSTRSPGVNSWPVAEGSGSSGLWARSESGIAPACDRGGWGALRSLSIGLLVLWLIQVSFREARAVPFATTGHPHDRYSIGPERLDPQAQIAQF